MRASKILLLGFVALGLSETVSANENAPHWCEDLGIKCRVGALADAQDKSLLSALENANVSAFLPTNLAQYLRRCEFARRDGHYNEFSLARLHTEVNPLRGVVDDVLFIPAHEAVRADLPSSGARIVVDCKGRHLQIRADSKNVAAQLALIKRAFDHLQMMQLIDSFRMAKDHYHASHDREITAAACPVETVSRRHKPAFFVSVWVIGTNGNLSLGLANVPPAFVDKDCFKKGFEIKAAVQEQETARRLTMITNIQKYQQALQDIRDEDDFIRSYCMEHTDDEYSVCQGKMNGPLRGLKKSLIERTDKESLRRFEEQELSEATTDIERNRHQARLIKLESESYDAMTVDERADFDKKVVEIKQWCLENKCACIQGAFSDLAASNLAAIHSVGESLFSEADWTELWGYNNSSDCQGKLDSDPFSDLDL